MKTELHPSRTQAGAALVVALILLVALSLMAISSMNTASLDLIMAGNEQYRSRAFATAEAAIERALLGGVYDSSKDYYSGGGTSAPATFVSTVSGTSDGYYYAITRPNNGLPEGAPDTNSLNGGTGYQSIHFRIEATGISERNARTVTAQQLYKVVKSSDSIANDAACGASNLDGTISSC